MALTDEAKKELKNEALTLAENEAKAAVEFVFKMIEIIIKDTENKFDDMLLPAMPMLKEKVMELADNINKED